jgi:hypothetical protein
MKTWTTAAAVVTAAGFALAAAAAVADDRPYTVAYYYKVRWGFQQEFERLFLKNHHPVLMAMKEAGRVKDVHMFRPTFHGDGRADWTFLVVITYASWEALGAPSQEEAIAHRLFPDQETFKREEQRRFEILDAHWDVPLVPVAAPR